MRYEAISRLIFIDEIHLRLGIEMVFASKLMGDCYLALGCYPHGNTSTVILLRQGTALNTPITARRFGVAPVALMPMPAYGSISRISDSMAKEGP